MSYSTQRASGTYARAERGQNDDIATESSVTLSVLVPTRHESGNVAPLIARLEGALAGIATEIVFVDDSDDGTPGVIESFAQRGGHDGCEVVLLHRPPAHRRGGLGGAVVDGMRRARGRWVCVIDGDLQHPPELVPVLLAKAQSEDLGLVVASRYTTGGNAASFAAGRSFLSHAASAAAKSTFPVRLRAVTDPMSGFFLVRRDRLDPEVLRPLGFKILLEVMVRTPGLRVGEVPYEFGDRGAGESKASGREGLAYLRHLGRLRFDRTGTGSDKTRRGPRRSSTHRYDIHGIIVVESDGYLPELESFRVRDLSGPPTIRVRIGRLPTEAPRPVVSDRLGRHLRYTESAGMLGFAADITVGERVEVLAAPLLRHSPHVLYTNLVEPILRWQFVQRGYALAHGACVVRNGSAFMVTARTDTGKTTTMLKLLDAQPYEFVSDDLTIVCPDGRVLPYPKPLTISRHTLHAVKTPRLTWRERSTLGLQSRLHSRSGRRFAFFLTRTGLPVATVNALVQLVVPPPKYPVQRLVPGVQVAADARLAGLFVIQRERDGFEWLQDADALEILLGNCEDAYGFPPYHHIEDFLLGATGEDLRAKERGVLRGAFEGRPSALLSSTRLDWAERIPALIEELTGDEPGLAAVIDLEFEAALDASAANGNGNGKGTGNGARKNGVAVGPTDESVAQ